MRYRTVLEATSFITELLKAKAEGKREFLGAKLDSQPAWSGTSEHKLDGSEIEAVYLSYLPATDKQKKQAEPAKLAGVKLERISGRLIDVRKCADDTIQVLFSNGLRNADGSIPFRGPNVNKGILCYLSVNEGLGEPVDDILARVPADLLEQLRANKLALAAKPKRKKKAENPAQGVLVMGQPEASTEPDKPGEEPRLKLK